MPVLNKSVQQRHMQRRKLYEVEDSNIVLTPYGGMVAIAESIRERIKEVGEQRFPYDGPRDAEHQDVVQACLKIIESELRKARKYKDKINKS